jgi:hypothetical protein
MDEQQSEAIPRWTELSAMPSAAGFWSVPDRSLMRQIVSHVRLKHLPRRSSQSNRSRPGTLAVNSPKALFQLWARGRSAAERQTTSENTADGNKHSIPETGKLNSIHARFSHPLIIGFEGRKWQWIIRWSSAGRRKHFEWRDADCNHCCWNCSCNAIPPFVLHDPPPSQTRQRFASLGLDRPDR